MWWELEGKASALVLRNLQFSFQSLTEERIPWCASIVKVWLYKSITEQCSRWKIQNFLPPQNWVKIQVFVLGFLRAKSSKMGFELVFLSFITNWRMELQLHEGLKLHWFVFLRGWGNLSSGFSSENQVNYSWVDFFFKF